MRITPTPIAGCVHIEPEVFQDARGELFEPWNAQRWAAAGLATRFVQALQCRSTRGVLRGLHYQSPKPQAKLIWVIEGEILDVAVDLRSGSPTFGQHVAAPLSGTRQLLIPEGCAHGYLVRSATAVVGYLISAPHDPSCDHSLAWDDPALGIDWGIDAPLLSERDRRAPGLSAVVPVVLSRS